MKYVLITGAYGGMGYQTTKMFARQGFTVFALDKKVKGGKKMRNGAYAERALAVIDTEFSDLLKNENID